MGLQITILCDNSISRPGIVGEHGFSALLQRGEDKVLFDTGPGNMSLPLNLKALNRNLDGLSRVFISHGHYDHTGGLKWVVQQAGKVQVVAHPAMFSKHMRFDPKNTREPSRYVGCPHKQQELEHLGAVFRFLDHTQEVDPGWWFVTGVERKPGQAPKDARLVRPKEEELVPDPLEDDSSILVGTDSGPVLVLGCAHSGVLNILDHVNEKMGFNKLHAILGGTHLMFYGLEAVSRFINKLEALSVDLVGVSHCTGMEGVIALSKHFGDRFTVASAGKVFEF